jgi:hypothetical protein
MKYLKLFENFDEEYKGCGCCPVCTGEEDCDCCSDCTCSDDDNYDDDDDNYDDDDDNYDDDEILKSLINEKNVAVNSELWSQCKSWAKSRYDVWPSAYALGAAAKRYKKKGGKWKKKKSNKK